METHLAEWLKGTPDGIEAESVLRTCVHCGFCLATCPTYLLLGNELDSPRGRIYLMKQVVEGEKPTMATMEHLDRCLTCLNCETTCPSGVIYGHLVDVGRKLTEEQVRRPLGQRMLRTALREGVTRRWLFDPAMRIGQWVRPLLPETLRSKVPPRRDSGPWPRTTRARRVLILNSCTQPAMMPAIDAATARVLDLLGIQTLVESTSGCCGAIRHHLNDHRGALDEVRRNIAAWEPHLDAGVEAIVMNASGCGAMVKGYAHLLRDDPQWSDRAQRIVSATRDLAEWLPEQLAPRVPELLGTVQQRGAPRIAFHPPCTLQHGQGIRGAVERLLLSLGVQTLPVADSHLCCGSAGTYSITQPALALQLRENKLANLQAGGPQLILSANIGCLAHLQSGTATPVRHWIEWLDELMAAVPASEGVARDGAGAAPAGAGAAPDAPGAAQVSA